jgi:hypothetical protein
LNKSRRVLFSLGPAHFPSSPTGPRAGLPPPLLTRHANRLLHPSVPRLAGRQTPPRSSAPYRTPLLSLNYASRPDPFSPFPPSVPAQRSHQAPSPFFLHLPRSVPLAAAHAPPLPLVLVTETPAHHCRLPGSPDSMKNRRRPAPHGELHPPGLPVHVEATSHLPLSPPVP